MRTLALLLLPALALADRIAPVAAALRLEDVATGLGDVTDFAFLPDGRMVITEKSGALRMRRADGTIAPIALFPVDDASEKGLLGVVPDPDFSRTRRLFVYLSAAARVGGTNLDRHRVVAISLRADGTIEPGSERVIVRGLRGPANHDGGALAVGPDGKLYIGVGDTGCNSGRAPDPPYTPTNFFPTCLTNGNGKVLRVNLDGTIPADNPLATTAAATACGEKCRDPVDAARTAPPRRDVWAWGFRNPWRFWFDPRTGRLWVGDVGEVTYEEVTIARAGRHHGWPWREGRSGWEATKCRETVPDTGACVDPIYVCRHGRAGGGVDGDCQSITGGVIVDSCRWPASHRGRYLFGDNANGRLWTLRVNERRDGVVAGSREDLGRIESGFPVSIRVGPDGDPYLAVLPGRDGRIVRVTPVAPERCPAPAQKR